MIEGFIVSFLEQIHLVNQGNPDIMISVWRGINFIKVSEVSTSTHNDDVSKYECFQAEYDYSFTIVRRQTRSLFGHDVVNKTK